jgi:small subunit ribosomal protein S3
LGQKTNPIGLRLGIIRTWNSRWFAPQRNFADLVHEDILVKRYINKRLDNAGIANVIISRAPKKVTVDIMTSRPGIVIGRRGAEVDKLREELQLLTKKDIMLNIVEVRKPELDARLVADSVARQLEGRVSFRRAMKKSIAATMKMGAQGIKIQCGGRLGGAEIARTEKYREGRVPLHTLRADIDYSTSTAHTTYGCIGVKVWICRGEILEMGQFGIPGEATTVQPDQQQTDDRGGRRPDNRGGGGGRDRRGKRPRGRIRRQDGPPMQGQGGPGQDYRPPHGRRPERPPMPPRTDGGKPGGGEKPS